MNSTIFQINSGRTKNFLVNKTDNGIKIEPEDFFSGPRSGIEVSRSEDRIEIRGSRVNHEIIYKPDFLLVNSKTPGMPTPGLMENQKFPLPQNATPEIAEAFGFSVASAITGFPLHAGLFA